MDLGTSERILLDEMSNVVCDSRPRVFVLSVIFGRGAFYVTGDHLFAVVLRERERGCCPAHAGLGHRSNLIGSFVVAAIRFIRF